MSGNDNLTKIEWKDFIHDLVVSFRNEFERIFGNVGIKNESAAEYDGLDNINE